MLPLLALAELIQKIQKLAESYKELRKNLIKPSFADSENTNPEAAKEEASPVKANISAEEGAELSQKALTLPSRSVGPNLKCKPDDIKLIEKLLGLPQTGVWSSDLEEAIKTFQTSIGYQPDGLIRPGSRAFRALSSYQATLASVPDIPISKGIKIQHPQPGAKLYDPFGMRKSDNPQKPQHLHTGIDCSTGRNSSVYAVADGIVVESGVQGTVVDNSNGIWIDQAKGLMKKGYGYYITIEHGDGYRSRYAHLAQKANFSKGQEVKMGEVIGKEGNTGMSTRPHLHFEILINSKAVDPMPFINGAKLFPIYIKNTDAPAE